MWLIFRWDKLKRAAQFLHEARSTLILHAFGTGVMLLAAMIVTISGKHRDIPLMAELIDSMDSARLQESRQ